MTFLRETIQMVVVLLISSWKLLFLLKLKLLHSFTPHYLMLLVQPGGSCQISCLLMSNSSLLNLSEPLLYVLYSCVEFFLFLCISQLGSLLFGCIRQLLPLDVQFLQTFFNFRPVIWFFFCDVVSRLKNERASFSIIIPFVVCI